MKKSYPRHQNSLQAEGNLSIYPVYFEPPSGVKKRLYQRRSHPRGPMARGRYLGHEEVKAAKFNSSRLATPC